MLAPSYRRTEEGFLIRVPEGGLAGVELTSPQSDIRWSQYPYLKIRFKPSEHPRKITVRWPPPSIDSTFSMSRQVPAGSAEALFNTYSYQPGSNKNPFSWGRFFVASPVGTVVVVFSEDFEIRGAELMRDVSYGEKLALIIEDLLNEEPLLVRTINGLAGHQVYGFLLIPFFGSALVLWLLGSGLLGRFGFSAIVLGLVMLSFHLRNRYGIIYRQLAVLGTIVAVVLVLTFLVDVSISHRIDRIFSFHWGFDAFLSFLQQAFIKNSFGLWWYLFVILAAWLACMALLSRLDSNQVHILICMVGVFLLLTYISSFTGDASFTLQHLNPGRFLLHIQAITIPLYCLWAQILSGSDRKLGGGLRSAQWSGKNDLRLAAKAIKQ